MTRPEEALERARASAAALREQGMYPEAQVAPPPSSAPGVGELAEWAMIEPDLREVRSTRRFGAPLTSLKRLLLRLLGQYHMDLLSQQTRFNVNLLIHVQRLEERLEALEQRALSAPPPSAEDAER